MKGLCANLAVLLSLQLALSPLTAQNPHAQLNIVVLEGEAAINNIGQRSAHHPVIRVEDENKKPISGAAVVFNLPTDGASGEFGNGSKTLIVTTDDEGIAAAQGLRANQTPGTLQIRVNASFRGKSAGASITQFNMAVPGKAVGGRSHSKTWIILAVIAGGAAAGGTVALGSKGTTAAATPSNPAVSQPISVTPGTGTVGPPR